MDQIEILSIFFVINIFITINFDKIKMLSIAIDKPDKVRKFHKKPTALAGGIILIINIFFYLIFLNFNEVLLINEIVFKDIDEINFFIFSCFLIFSLGVVDDNFNLGPLKKFFILSIILGQFIYFNESIIIETIKFLLKNIRTKIIDICKINLFRGDFK